MTTEIHVRFARTHDAEDAFPTVAGHVAGARLAEAGIEVDCDPVAEAAVMRELEHAIDEWVAAHELPFLADEIDEHTLLVHPPGD